MKKPELKYISEYLNELESPIKEMALSNHLEYCNTNAGIAAEIVHKKVIGIYEAIIQGFFWSATPEGKDFWRKLSNEHLEKFLKQYPNLFNQSKPKQ